MDMANCVIMYVTRWEGVKKFEIFMDVIDGSPLRQSRWDKTVFALRRSPLRPSFLPSLTCLPFRRPLPPSSGVSARSPSSSPSRNVKLFLPSSFRQSVSPSV